MPISSQTREELEATLANESAVIRRAFIALVKFLRSDVVIRHIITRFRARDLAGVVAIIRREVAEFSAVFGKAFTRIANEEVKRINRSIQQERVAKPTTLGETKSFRVSFEPGNPEAAKELRKIGLQFVRQFTADQRRLVKRVLSESLKAGEGPLSAARKLKESIGLTDYQQQVVENYRMSLETGSRDALDRVLRDKRFDSTVTRAIDTDNVLPRAQIERMVKRYAERMIDYRAKTIARTEAMRSVSRARHAAWRIAVNQLGKSQHHVHKTWIATLDDRVRDSHADMDHQRVTGMDTPFESGDGNLLLYPGDPLAPAEDVISCRCAVLYNIPV